MRMRAGLLQGFKELNTMTAQEREDYDARRAAFARKIWLETLEVEDTLNSHTCSVEPFYFYFVRQKIFKLSAWSRSSVKAANFIYSIRVLISDEFSRYVPLAETWVKHSLFYLRALAHRSAHLETQTHCSIDHSQNSGASSPTFTVKQHDLNTSSIAELHLQYVAQGRPQPFLFAFSVTYPDVTI